MPHRSHLCTIVIDVPTEAHAATTAFWGGATGKEQRPLSFPEFHGARLHDALTLLVQELGEGQPRIHLDFHTDDVPAEVARLQALGGTVVEHHEEWTVMADPSGQPFCVVKAPDGTLGGADVQTWP